MQCGFFSVCGMVMVTPLLVRLFQAHTSAIDTN
jgi:hypothetical protein